MDIHVYTELKVHGDNLTCCHLCDGCILCAYVRDFPGRTPVFTCLVLYISCIFKLSVLCILFMSDGAKSSFSNVFIAWSCFCLEFLSLLYILFYHDNKGFHSMSTELTSLCQYSLFTRNELKQSVFPDAWMQLATAVVCCGDISKQLLLLPGSTI